MYSSATWHVSLLSYLHRKSHHLLTCWSSSGLRSAYWLLPGLSFLSQPTAFLISPISALYQLLYERAGPFYTRTRQAEKHILLHAVKQLLILTDSIKPNLSHFCLRKSRREIRQKWYNRFLWQILICTNTKSSFRNTKFYHLSGLQRPIIWLLNILC